MSVEFEDNRQEVSRSLQQTLSRALEKVGLYVEAQAKTLTPVDTGRLINSINHEVNESTKKVTIGTNVNYAVYVEKGTSKQQAQPYLTPAAERNISTIKRLVEDEYRELND